MANGMLHRVQQQRGTDQQQNNRPANRPQRGQQRRDAAQRDEFVQAVAPPKLKTRKPRGIVPWPLILVEGEQYAGKDYMIGELALSKQVGTVYWLSIGERVPDEYPPDVYDIAIVDHDGTYGDIIGQVEAARAVAQAALDAKAPPVVLAINSATEWWRMISGFVYGSAAKSKAGQELLAEDPNADIKPGRGHWNFGNRKDRALMTMLKAFPGVVVVTARGRMVSATGSNGQPLVVNGKPVKEYKVDAQGDLAFETSAWVRLARGVAPKIIGMRSINPKVALDPKKNEPRSVPDLTLEQLIFDVLGCKVGESIARETPTATPEDGALDLEQIRGIVWEAAQALGWDSGQLAADYMAWSEGAIKEADVATLELYYDQMPAPTADGQQEGTGA